MPSQSKANKLVDRHLLVKGTFLLWFAQIHVHDQSFHRQEFIYLKSELLYSKNGGTFERESSFPGMLFFDSIE